MAVTPMQKEHWWPSFCVTWKKVFSFGAGTVREFRYFKGAGQCFFPLFKKEKLISESLHCVPLYWVNNLGFPSQDEQGWEYRKYNLSHSFMS